MERSTRTKMRWGRVVAAVVVWLGFGMFVNWAMTWSAISLYWMRADQLSFESTDAPGAWPVTVPASWPDPTEASWMDYRWWSLAAYSAGAPRFVYILPYSSEASGSRIPRPMNDRTGLFEVGVMKAGFPARSFRCIIRDSPAGSDVRDAVVYHSRSGGATYLPFQPLWPGFALNTLFYTAIAWLLWRIPILIRRHRRRARGLCVKCAYNRAGLPPGSPCPECGDTPSPSPSAAS